MGSVKCGVRCVVSGAARNASGAGCGRHTMMVPAMSITLSSVRAATRWNAGWCSPAHRADADRANDQSDVRRADASVPARSRQRQRPPQLQKRLHALPAPSTWSAPLDLGSDTNNPRSMSGQQAQRGSETKRQLHQTGTEDVDGEDMGRFQAASPRRAISQGPQPRQHRAWHKNQPSHVATATRSGKVDPACCDTNGRVGRGWLAKLRSHQASLQAERR